MKKLFKNLVALLFAAFVTTPMLALAQTSGSTTDFTTITNAIDTSTVKTGLMTAGGIVIGVILVVWGIKKIIAMFGSR